MTDAAGAFHATQDADSEGEEGKYFAWSPAELKAVLGAEDGRRAATAFGVTAQGTFEHGQERARAPGADGGARPGLGHGRGRDAALARVRPREAPRRAVEAHRPGARRQGARGLERPDDPRTRPRRARLRAAGVGGAGRPRRGRGARPPAAGRPPAPRVPGRGEQGGCLPRGLGRARLGTGGALPGDVRPAMARGGGPAGGSRTGAVLGRGAEGVPDRASRAGGPGGRGVRAPRQRGALGGEPADRGERRAGGADRSPRLPRPGRGVPLADAGHRAGEPVRLRPPLVRGGCARGRGAGRDAGRQSGRARAVSRVARRTYAPTLSVAAFEPGAAAPVLAELAEGKTSAGAAAAAYVCRNFTCTLPRKSPEALREELSRTGLLASAAREGVEPAATDD